MIFKVAPCFGCDGAGHVREITNEAPLKIGESIHVENKTCTKCEGSGVIAFVALGKINYDGMIDEETD